MTFCSRSEPEERGTIRRTRATGLLSSSSRTAIGQDALTGERVIAMPAFHRLCPARLLRPATTMQRSARSPSCSPTSKRARPTAGDVLGDASAYNLVRDHFSFLSDRVQRDHGFVVGTVGDAVMAAFSRPDDAVCAALAIQDDVASFNSARGGGASAPPIALKLGLHAGPCIAVTTARCSTTWPP